jgi:hypothetical protein
VPGGYAARAAVREWLDGVGTGWIRVPPARVISMTLGVTMFMLLESSLIACRRR